MATFKVGQKIKRVKSSHTQVPIGNVVYVLETYGRDRLEVSKTRGGEKLSGNFSSDYFVAQGKCGTGETKKKLLLC